MAQRRDERAAGRAWWRGLATLALLLGLMGGWLPLPRPAQAAAGVRIVVNSPLDTSGNGTICTLRDAISTANDPNTPVGGCQANPDATPETEIYFSIGNGPAATEIVLGSTLPTVTTGVVISGPSQNTLIIRRASDPLNRFRLLEIQTTAPVTIGGVTLSGGDAGSGAGGAILKGGSGPLTLEYATITGNRASTGGGFATQGNVTVESSTIISNGAESGGGFSALGNATVTNSAISGNVADYGNGGGFVATGGATIVNSTITSNSTVSPTSLSSAGGGFFSGGDVTVTNSTFGGNSAIQGGDGFYALGNATVVNSIFASESATNNCVNIGTFTDGGGNVSNDASCVGPAPTTSITVAEVGLTPLASNGGPTPTIALAPTSPARGRGVLSVCNAAPVGGVDQRGAPRPAGGPCDSGAFQTPTIVVTPASLTEAMVQVPYRQFVTAEGGFGGYSFTLTAGTLPPGITLDPIGMLIGTPTSTGTWAFTLTATDVYGYAGARAYTLTVGKQSAFIILIDLDTFPYDGQPHAATAITFPPDLATVTITYTDSAQNTTTTPPTAVGTYTVTATLDNPNYAAAPATGTITIVAAASPTPSSGPSPSPSPSPSPAPAPNFSDVPSDYWAAAQIAQIAQRGITNGCFTDGAGNRSFCPERAVTRGEMAAFIIRTVTGTTAAPAGPATPTFADVPPTHPQYGFIEALAARGITTGCGDPTAQPRTYCPDDNVTRAEMAAFLIRALTGNTATPTGPATPTFADVPIGHPQYGFIEALYSRGVTTGCGTNDAGQLIYCPGNPVTRAEMAVFVIRAYP